MKKNVIKKQGNRRILYNAVAKKRAKNFFIDYGLFILSPFVVFAVIGFWVNIIFKKSFEKK